MTDYRITPVKHWNSQWAWWAFRSRNIAGTTPVFKIAKADHYYMVAGERLCCWSTAADTDTWNDFDNVAIGASDLEFSNNDPFPSSTYIYASALPMYPFSRVQRKMNEWSLSPWVGQTASTTNFILGNATARATMDGRTAPALPFYGFKITGDRVGNKNKAILSAYNHPSETPGAYQLEAAVNFLLGTSVEAEVLRNHFEWYVYPCLNPQGVWSGYFRSSPQTPASDNNRIWDTTGTNEAIDAFKTAMAADTGGAIDVAFDYHSQMEDVGRFSNVYDTDGTFENYYLTEMQALLPGYTLREITETSTIIYWQINTLGASLGAFPECGGITSQGISHWQTHAVDTLRSVYNMLTDGRFTYDTKVYYVAAADGNDSYDGLSPSYTSGINGPFATISHAASVASAGDNIYVRTGTYNEQVQFTVPVTLSGYLAETPVIDGTGITMGSYTGLVDFNGSVGSHISGVIVKNLAIKNAGQDGNNEYNGIYMRYVDQIVIDNCFIDNIVNSGIMLRNCDTFTIKNCTVKNAANCTANMDENISISFSTYGYIYNNTVYATIIQNDGNGIGICTKDGCDYMWIHHNLVHDCFNNGIYVCGWTSPVSHVWVYNNVIYGVDAIWIASEAGDDVDSVYIYNNVCYRFYYVAINISSTASNGLRSNIYICNNTIDYSLDSGGSGIMVQTDNLSGTILIRNNVTYINEGTNGQIRVLNTALAKCTIDHNVVYGKNSYDPDGVTHYDEVSQPDRETRGADPLFNNRAAHIYTLQAGSPCRNAGAAWTGQPATDLADNQRSCGAAIDVGAYEYQE